jgi:hypothetical protein
MGRKRKCLLFQSNTAHPPKADEKSRVQRPREIGTNDPYPTLDPFGVKVSVGWMTDLLANREIGLTMTKGELDAAEKCAFNTHTLWSHQSSLCACSDSLNGTNGRMLSFIVGCAFVKPAHQ